MSCRVVARKCLGLTGNNKLESRRIEINERDTANTVPDRIGSVRHTDNSCVNPRPRLVLKRLVKHSYRSD